jgi:hypothetical protein
MFSIPQSNGLSCVGVFEILSLLCTSVHDVEGLQCVNTCETIKRAGIYEHVCKSVRHHSELFVEMDGQHLLL